jgi:hypothetical protein
MNLAPAALLPVLDARSKDFLCAVEFYLPTVVPHVTHGLQPHLAEELFATETCTFTYLSSSVNYVREALSMPALNRIITKQSNSVTIRFSNVSKRLATFILNNQVEGMRVVLRVLSRAALSNSSVSPLECSFIAFVGRCGPTDGFDRKDASITVKQDLGQVEAQVPPREFQRTCPLDFGGSECLGNELLTAKNAAFQAAFAADGRRGCNKTFGACTTFANTEFFQGVRIYQIQGSFQYKPHHGLLYKIIRYSTPIGYLASRLFGKKAHRVGQSLEDGTPYGSAIPSVFGRWRMEGIPMQFRDDGETIHFKDGWCRGPIAAILNLRCDNPEFNNPPVTVVHHYGNYGGETDQAADAVFPDHSFHSRLAYSTGGVTGSNIEVEDPAPDLSAMIAGAVVGKMATAHLMNRCGSGRVSGGGISYAPILGGSWTDNPADMVRLVLTDAGLLALDENFIEAYRSAIAAFYCDGAIMDTSNAERLLLPNTETATAGVDYHRYNSTSLITAGCWPVATVQFPFSRVDHEAVYEFFDPAAPPLPADIPVKTFYRKRYTVNTALTEQKKAVDFLFDTLLPSFRGFLTWNSRGQIAVNCEKPADSTDLRVASIVGATTVKVLDAVPYIKDINEAGFGHQLIGKLLIGVGLITSEVRRVTSAVYDFAYANTITLAASATGGSTATASGATLTGGSAFVQAHGTVTIAGTLVADETVTATINGIDVTFTIQAGMLEGGILPAGATVAAALGFAINAHPVLSKYIEANNDSWHDFVDIYAKCGVLTLSSALEEAHDIAEETIRVMLSFAGKALTYANTTKANILDGSFAYLGTDGQTRYNQFKGTYHDPLRDFAEQPLIVNDYDHQDDTQVVKPLEIDLSAVDNYNQAARLLNGAAAKFGDGMDFFSWRSNGLALQLEEGDVVCLNDDSGEFRNVPVRVEQAQWNSNYEVAFKARIYSTSMFDDAVEQTDVTIPSGLTNFASAPPAITFNIVDFPPDGLVQSTDGTAGITSIRGGAIFGASIYAQYAKVKVIVRAGVAVDETVTDNLKPADPASSDWNATFEFIASADGLYTVELEVCNQWGCNPIKPTADIIIGFGSTFGIARENSSLLLREESGILEREH